MSGTVEAGGGSGGLFALARRYRGYTEKVMPISTPGDVLNDQSNLILRY